MCLFIFNLIALSDQLMTMLKTFYEGYISYAEAYENDN